MRVQYPIRTCPQTVQPTTSFSFVTEDLQARQRLDFEHTRRKTHLTWWINTRVYLVVETDLHPR